MRDDDRILDAARDCILTHGVRRTTVADVARRARVSRATVYSRCPDRSSLLRAAFGRQMQSHFEYARESVAGLGTVREGLATGCAVAVERICEDPMFLRMLEVEPEVFLPYVFERLGEVQRGIIERLTEYIERGQQERSVRAGDARAMAATIELLGRSLVLSARATERGSEPASAYAELRQVIDSYLRPAHVDGT